MRAAMHVDDGLPFAKGWCAKPCSPFRKESTSQRLTNNTKTPEVSQMLPPCAINVVEKRT